jgi:hypothetical protein
MRRRVPAAAYPRTMTPCEAPRCDASATDLVVARDVHDRFPGLADPDGSLRLLLCADCAAQVLDALARTDRMTLLAYPMG